MAVSDIPEEQLLDHLTRQDELLERLIKILSRMDEDLDDIEDVLEIQTTLLSDITGQDLTRDQLEEITEDEKISGPIQMSYNTPADTKQNDPDIVERIMPFNGKLTSVTFGWLDGSNFLSPFSLDLYDKNGNIVDELIPLNEESDWISGNDFIQQYDVKRSVKQGQKFRAEFFNNDTNDSHYNFLILMVEED